MEPRAQGPERRNVGRWAFFSVVLLLATFSALLATWWLIAAIRGGGDNSSSNSLTLALTALVHAIVLGVVAMFARPWHLD